MRRIFICLLSIVSLNTWADCPADKNETKQANKLEVLNLARTSYETDWAVPDSVGCYYQLLLLESKLAFINDEFESLEKLAKEMLAIDPSDAWGIFFMRYSLRALGKPSSAFSIDQMPNGSIDGAFAKKLSEILEIKK
ncbi:MAG: hypothetical protein OEY19_13470 [Gammaproteobacteria bacterium]|nr:hypothetical protein [Gammaproteobacteria bacterium]